MYAVLEFPKKEFALVPFNWIEEDMCFWPKNITHKQFQHFVAAKREPLLTWPKFKFVKILFSTGMH